jgi:uncharacterized protein (TIGR01244 family)
VSDPEDIRNFLRLSDRITTSGRLKPEDPERLAAMGARRVIYLAMADHPEAIPDADAAMARAGLDYTHIPVPWGAPEECHYRAFVEALEAGDTPVHVHCIMNWRVSAFLYRWHCDQGMDETEAREQMERIWSPETSDDPSADKWVALIGKGR